MADPRFYTNSGPFSLRALAEAAGAEIRGGDDPERLIRDVAPLDTAEPDELSFFDNAAYRRAYETTRAGACVVGPMAKPHPREDLALLVTDQPYRGYALIARMFYPPPAGGQGISGEARIDPTAELGEGVDVGPGAVIGPLAEVGANCRIGANAVIGPAVRFGRDGVVEAGATVRYCIAQDRVRIAAGARIGEDGFGFAMSEGGPLKVPQLGRVLIGNDVDIGANTTIDRGSGPDTEIGDGTIIDNLVQIAHNVKIGRNCIIVGMVGISGSATLGDNVVIGGQAGFVGHVTIGAGAKIAGASKVFKDVPPGAAVMGYPAVPQKEFWRQIVTLKRLVARKRGER